MTEEEIKKMSWLEKQLSIVSVNEYCGRWVYLYGFENCSSCRDTDGKGMTDNDKRKRKEYEEQYDREQRIIRKKQDEWGF